MGFELATAATRLFPRLDVMPSGCWEWTGAKHPFGYGFIRYEGRNVYTHRAAYEVLVGPIAAGAQLDHLCRNPPCCNPEHLEPVTPQTNTLRGRSIQAANARKTHCLRGHAFTGDNLRIDKTGRRICRACKRTWKQRAA